MTHVTHNFNDLNIASIRISKLRDLMKEYEPTSFETKVETNHYLTLWSLTITLIILYVCSKCGLFRLFKRLITPKPQNNIVYALRDLNSEAINNELVEEGSFLTADSNATPNTLVTNLLGKV